MNLQSTFSCSLNQYTYDYYYGLRTLNYDLCDGVYCYDDYLCQSGYCNGYNSCSSVLAPWAVILIVFFSVFCFCGLFLRICAATPFGRRHHHVGYGGISHQYYPIHENRVVYADNYLPPPPMPHHHRGGAGGFGPQSHQYKPGDIQSHPGVSTQFNPNVGFQQHPQGAPGAGASHQFQPGGGAGVSMQHQPGQQQQPVVF
eukprot:403345414